MAKRVITTLVDDIDGTVLDEGRGETVEFALDGVGYEIDLSVANAQALREALTQYTTRGRRVGKLASARTGRSRSGGSKEDLSAARTWLRSRGHEVAERGRISGELMALYQARGE